MTSRAKAWVIISAALLFTGLGIYTSWRTCSGSTDFDTYYYAARRIIDGIPLYTEIRGVSPYIYPHCFACIITPLAIFSIGVSSLIWYFLNLALMLGTLVFSFRLIFTNESIDGVSGRIRFLPKAVFLVMIAAAFLDNISLLQANILVLFSMTAALYYSENRRDILAAFFLSLAISIKVLPVLLLVYFLLKKKVRLLSAALLWLVFFVAILPALSMGFGPARDSISLWINQNFLKAVAHGPNFEIMDSFFNPGNQSISAFLSRWLAKNDSLVLYWKEISYKYGSFFIGWSGPLTSSAILTVSKISVAALVLTALAACMRARRACGKMRDNYEYSAILLSCLLASPILRIQYFIFTLFPAMLILRESSSGSSGRSSAGKWLILFAALYFSQSIKLFRIIGLGTFAVLLLFGLVLGGLVACRRENA